MPKISEGQMSRQSIGVDPFKGIIRWMYPDAVRAFDPCAKIHDEDYKTVDWSRGKDATLKIDQKFWRCCIAAADNDLKLIEQANWFYKVCRRWGIMRAGLWKCFISW